MTVIVNIGGDSVAGQAIVTGTKLSELIVTGTVLHSAGDNITAPPGIVYQYIRLVPARYDAITNVVINFTVPVSWLDENHILPGGIVLWHPGADGWEALPTTFQYAKDGTAYFSVQSSGFSVFAIAGTPTLATPINTVTTPQDSPAGIIQSPIPAAATVTKAPVTKETTAPPVTVQAPARSAPFPLVPVIAAICCIGLAGGGWYARRWWIRRQNPALFEEYG
jgi:PGF-pre-PGF domain-containing protein